MKSILFLSLLLSSILSFAGVEVYTGTAGEVLYIESASKLGADAYLVKMEGIESKWADHVFQTKKYTRPSGDRFSFDYEEELSTGKRTLTYEIIVGDGYDLVKGSRVKKIQLFYQEGKGKPLSLVWNAEKTEKSQKIDLASEFKKKPFKPEVD